MNDITKRFISSLFLVLILYLSLSNIIILFTLLCFVSFFSLDEFIKIFKKIFYKNNLFFFISIIILLLYIIFFSLMVWTFLIPFNNEKIISLMLILIICSLTDIGGYLVGKIIGGKKFSKISPNKTYSGVVGSFIFPLIICYLIYDYFNDYLNFNINIFVLIFSVSFISQLGDLFISFFKRMAKIKDTGSVIPGHGGVLDRIDGILFGLPLGVVLISI